MKLRLSFFILNLIFIIGLLFPGYSPGVYFCTLLPFFVLYRKNQGVIKFNKLLLFIVIFLINVVYQVLIGYPPNIKLLLNFLGNLLMVYSIISLLNSEIIFREYLRGFLKLNFLLAAGFIVAAFVFYGIDFFFIDKNQVYSKLGIYSPALRGGVTKQITAPFLAFASIMALYMYKPNNFFINTGIIVFIISVLVLAIGSRSVILSIIITTCIFGLKKYLSKTPIAITFVCISVGALIVLNSYFEDYLNMIRLIDIRGIIYSQILSEVVANPIGVGYGNAVEYLVANNEELFLNSGSAFQDLRSSNESFNSFTFDSFPVNVESSLFIMLLEQGFAITILFYTYFVKKISQLCLSKDRFFVLFSIASSVVIFTSLTEDNFLLIPFLIYVSLFLRLVFFQSNKVICQQ